MHIYIFGSTCRGDISRTSDVDMLALIDEDSSSIGNPLFSEYSYTKMESLWRAGHPFAWHLLNESRLVFSGNGIDVIKSYGLPAPYETCTADCRKFLSLFLSAKDSLSSDRTSAVFDLGMIFLAARNIATCFSLGTLGHGVFARDAAKRLGDMSIPITLDAYEILERARILSSRADGDEISDHEITSVVSILGDIEEWMRGIVRSVS
jgi:hypothetical protein